MRRSVFSRLAHLSCLYTVSLTPRTDRSSLEVVVFPPPEDDQVTVTLRLKVSAKLCGNFVNIVECNVTPAIFNIPLTP